MEFRGEHFVVKLVIPMITICKGDKRKVICREEKDFEDTMIKIFLPFKLNKGICIGIARFNGYPKLLKYIEDLNAKKK